MPKKLRKREKNALYLAAGFILLFFTFQFVVFPLIDNQKKLERRLQAETRTLTELLQLKSEYDQIVKKTALAEGRFSQRKPGFTLFSFLDRLAGETGLKDKIIYMKPSTSIQKDKKYKKAMVEMKLQSIDLKQLATYLYRIETSENMVFVHRISISKEEKGKGLVNAVLNVVTFEV